MDAEQFRSKRVMTFVRLHPDFDGLVPPDARIEKLSGGFTFTEGPLWRASGVLWFSDVVGNVIRQWSPNGKIVELLRPGGYDGTSLPAGAFIGPNGMTGGRGGAVMLCQHGNRRIAQVAADMTVTTVVASFEGKKLNAPNDLVYRADGTLFFTDPPYGLPRGDADPAKELPFNGVFKVSDGTTNLIIRDMTRPNGLAISPDNKTLYVANSDDNRRLWMRYDLATDGTVSAAAVFRDVSKERETGLPDGMKLDSEGRLWATGPGGIWVMAPDGRHLGTIKLPEQPANCAWGDDGRSLYITAETGLYRLKTLVMGQRLVYM
jgi:gluconolactonase